MTSSCNFYNIWGYLSLKSCTEIQDINSNLDNSRQTKRKENFSLEQKITFKTNATEISWTMLTVSEAVPQRTAGEGSRRAAGRGLSLSGHSAPGRQGAPPAAPRRPVRSRCRSPQGGGRRSKRLDQAAGAARSQPRRQVPEAAVGPSRLESSGRARERLLQEHGGARQSPPPRPLEPVRTAARRWCQACQRFGAPTGACQPREGLLPARSGRPGAFGHSGKPVSGRRGSPALGSGRTLPPGHTGTAPRWGFAFVCSMEQDHLPGQHSLAPFGLGSCLLLMLHQGSPHALQLRGERLFSPQVG